MNKWVVVRKMQELAREAIAALFGMHSERNILIFAFLIANIAVSWYNLINY